MRNFKIPIILGSAAVIVIIITIIIVTSGDSVKGLYITDASGSVSITNSDNGDSAGASGMALNQSDIITVGENSFCTIAYKSGKSSEDNYIVLAPNTQLVVTDKLTGKNDGEVYLNRGTLICGLASEVKHTLNVRTADTMIVPDKTVSKISYTTDGFDSFTTVYVFMGTAKLQLYDAMGNKVNNPEPLVEKHSACVTASDSGPEFAYLNVEFSLDELTAFDLKNILSIAAFIDDFPFDTAALKAAYDASPDAEAMPQPSDTETTVTDGSDSSDIIQTAEPITTTSQQSSPIVIEPPAVTTAPPATSPPQTTTTQKPATTEQTTTASPNNTLFTVIVIIGDDETIQEVAYGQNADKPADPVISGKKFIGWDGSFENVTSDRTITALFEDDAVVYHTVKIVIADKTTSIQVADGQPAAIPTSISVAGYKFIGWDTDYSCVRSDITVTAILEKEVITVTFMVNGMAYPTTVEAGGTVVPPFIPTVDVAGNNFTGWDKPLTNITADTTITALFDNAMSLTVTFVIDGMSYPTYVSYGGSAVPPFMPLTNSLGQSFVGWDREYTNVTTSIVVTAIFA